MDCVDATSCPKPSGGASPLCAWATCENNVCGIYQVPAGMEAGQQTPHDCQVFTCGASGELVNVNDPMDVPPDDSNECTKEVCDGANPTYEPTPYVVCTGGYCLPNGTCKMPPACTALTFLVDCKPPDCIVASCPSSTCKYEFAQPNTPCNLGKDICDGMGNCVPKP